MFYPILGSLCLGIIIRFFVVHRKLKYKDDKQDNYAEAIVSIVLSGLIAFVVDAVPVLGCVFIAAAGWLLKRLCEKANTWQGGL